MTGIDAGEAIRRAVEAWNARDLDALVALLAEDVFWDDPAMPEPARGREAVRRFAAALFRAFPDLEYRPVGEPLVAAGGARAVQPWRLSGTMLGPLDPPGFAPTGRLVEIEGIDLVEVRDGLLSRIVTRFDGLRLAEQVGLLPARPRPGSAAERLLVRIQRVVAFFQRRGAGAR